MSVSGNVKGNFLLFPLCKLFSPRSQAMQLILLSYKALVLFITSPMKVISWKQWTQWLNEWNQLQAIGTSASCSELVGSQKLWHQILLQSSVWHQAILSYYVCYSNICYLCQFHISGHEAVVIKNSSYASKMKRTESEEMDQQGLESKRVNSINQKDNKLTNISCTNLLLNPNS